METIIHQTTDYEQFSLLENNRKEGVSDSHVKTLMASIQRKNLLHLNPIIVNDKMQVIGGQHRLEAAKRLKIPIYYQIDKTSCTEDMLLMGFSKKWQLHDVLNFYVKNGNVEYIKFSEFIIAMRVEPTMGITLILGRKRDSLLKFRMGEFKFDCKYTAEMFSNAKDAVEAIRAFSIGYQAFLKNAKFWAALMSIVSHPDYKHSRLLSAIKRYTYRIGPKSQQGEYIRMLFDIYNYRTTYRISPTSEVSDE